MISRAEYHRAAPAVLSAMRGLEATIRSGPLETALLELVRMRVSQVNGCAFCLDMHGREARAAGITQQQLDLLTAWREAPCFSARQRAALTWAEALTLIARAPVDDALYAEAAAQFDAAALTHLSLAIIAINGWNRLSIAFGTPLPPASAKHESNESAHASF